MDDKYLLELIGREPIELKGCGIEDFIKGKKILVTGGGGFIGSQLCRTAAEYFPKKITILDIYENNAYMLQQELMMKYGDKIDSEIYITTVCDRAVLEKIFEKEKPDIVIHAAAHKHVPLMEKVPAEAVKNNVLGTINVVELSEKYFVKNFILISTDKAVNPSNVMGITKRICEMIVQNKAKSCSNTIFSSVRFGNVAGSSGSVIPLFQEQLKTGKITVSHPDMDRYFMTVSEAAQLVLIAGSMAKGGEIFVLNMGKPVKIVDIAKKMIELGELENEVEIVYTEPRPGEKLKEEFLLAEEGLKKTLNDKIFIGSPIDFDEKLFNRNLAELFNEVNSKNFSNEKILALLKKAVSQYNY